MIEKARLDLNAAERNSFSLLESQRRTERVFQEQQTQSLETKFRGEPNSRPRLTGRNSRPCQQRNPDGSRPDTGRYADRYRLPSDAC